MKKLLRWLDSIKSAEVYKGKTLIETTRYKDFALWWTLRTRIYNDLLQFFSSGTWLYRTYSKQRIIARFSLVYIIFILAQSFISKLLSFGQKKNDLKNPIVLTAQFSSWKPVRAISTGKLEKAHVIFEPILKILPKVLPEQNYISLESLGFSGLGKLKQIVEMQQASNLGYFRILESYLGIDIVVHFLIIRRYFIGQLEKMRKSTLPKSNLRFNGIDVFSVFYDYFDYYFTIYLPLLVLFYELGLKVCKQENPALILLSHEYGAYERALIMAAHNQHIPSLAIQHGIIDEFKTGYMYSANDVALTGSAQYPFVPLANKTAVYGSFTKHLLTEKSSYPNHAVEITGQPRYDALQYADKLYDKAIFVKHHQIDPEKKIVLITTQPIPMENIREEFIFSTIQALKEVNNIQIIIKPHHNERLEWYEKRIGNQDLIILPPLYDTYEAIFACDLLIAQTSTTIIEALILDKEVVVVNLSKLPEVLPWVEENAVLGVYNKANLSATFKDALFNTEKKAIRRMNRRAFLMKHVYKTDGKASNRVVDIILSLLQTKSKEKKS